jgi:hypothetical protein
MKNINTTYVDKLCLKFIFLCIVNNTCLRVAYIQKRKPFVLNSLYIYLLTFFDISVKYYPLEKTSGNYKKAFNITSKCIERYV